MLLKIFISTASNFWFPNKQSCLHIFLRSSNKRSTCILCPPRVYCELTTWPAPKWLNISVGRALHRYRRGHGLEYHLGLNFSGFNFTTASVLYNLCSGLFIYSLSDFFYVGNRLVQPSLCLASLTETAFSWKVKFCQVCYFNLLCSKNAFLISSGCLAHTGRPAYTKKKLRN